LSDQSRALPDQPSLRYLKVEAKRRLSAGEFATLHDAQLAIAREHGLASWAALKEYISAGTGHGSPVLAQARWVISRFGAAETPGWQVPGADELREHFDDRFLRLIPPETLVRTLTGVVSRLREELVITLETPLRLRAQIGGMQLEAAAEAGPPHRLTGLRLYPLGERVTDPRVRTPSARTSGAVPPAAAAVAEESVAELGLPGLVLAGAPAGARPGDGTGWVAARGWARLESARADGASPEQASRAGASPGEASRDGASPGEASPEALLDPGHRFPAYSVTKLITATVVLRLAADGRIGLDDPANAHLRAVRLGDDAVTVRELLTHTAGLSSPGELFAEDVPELVTLTGPLVPRSGPRGTFSYSNGGYGLLGQLIADVTGETYPEAAARLVLAPLGMSGASFPASWPSAGAVTGYRLAGDGLFEPAPARVCILPAAGGLWATAADLVRFGLSWASLLPAALAREALRPHATRDSTGAQMGLGWLLNEPKDVCGHAGVGPGAASSLIIRMSTGQPSVALANRLVPIEPANARLLRPVA
jgi:CubicO group peptidase (beta-lactamase class C family)